MDQPPARRGGRRRRRRGGGSADAAAAAGARADVLAVEGGGAAATPATVTTAGAAATQARRRNRRRSRRRRDRSAIAAAAGATDEAAAASEMTETPVPDAIPTQRGSALEASCHLEAGAAHLSDSELQTTTENIMNSNTTRKRDSQAGNKVLKVSAADGAAYSCLARHEHSVGQIEASSSKLYRRSDIRLPIDNCTAQGSDSHNRDSEFPEMKSDNLSENLEEVYQQRICPDSSSLQKSEEYKENGNGASLNTSSLEEKKRRKKRGGKRHNRCKTATSQDSPLPSAADNSDLMAVLSENNTSCLEPKEQRENQEQNKVTVVNLVPVDNAKRSEAYGVNLGSATEKSCELGTSNLDSTFENRCDLGRSSLDYTNMERNGLQEQYVLCSSNDHNANYLSPSRLAEAYMEKLNLVFSPGWYLGFPKKKLLILDLNGLLADINDDYHNAHMADAKVRGKLVFRRPYCDDFLNFCALNFELGVWSSRKKENVASVVDIVMRDFKPRLLFCWDMSKCTFTGHKTLENRYKPLVLKELRKLWNKEEPDLPWEEGDYSASNTLLVDDSPYKALRNPPHTAIFPRSYSYLNWNDNSLGPGGDLRVYLQNLASADDVECFVRNNPFGQPFITESDPHWNFYAQIANNGSAPLTCCA
ncbi:unnamed protein product [Urochloa decumbens]|uniref:FCP1 homology domain-containing protein n=1 Tax=Urochloa decumbens TaxID=240449 RepID=A0ABC8YLQ1_9POAL